MPKRIALTVDVEPDWGVRGTRAFQEVTPRFLRFLEGRQARATFFVVSDLMDVCPQTIGAVAQRNEVGSHGRSHRLLDRLGPVELRRELRHSRERLDECGRKVRGFRAPFFRRCGGFFERVAEAGYCYDASLGSVTPGPWNGRLNGLPSPFRVNGVYEFPTSAMGGGLLPLSLTWLRLCGPLTWKLLPSSPTLLYLHLHEFLPPETASCLPAALRRVLTRNCGEAAWVILGRAMDAMDAEFTTCGKILDDHLEQRRQEGPRPNGQHRDK